jgi:hypothetical protein
MYFQWNVLEIAEAPQESYTEGCCCRLLGRHDGSCIAGGKSKDQSMPSQLSAEDTTGVERHQDVCLVTGKYQSILVIGKTCVWRDLG